MLRFILYLSLCTLSFLDFNTSHVTVYQCLFYLYCSYIFISIHPMLRFILTALLLFRMNTKFQYIPCYGLSQQCLAVMQGLEHFNTSHVTVYPNASAICRISFSFQYIPCYGLSYSELEHRAGCDYFNTSHVTVYRDATGQDIEQPLFQYIPCYGLSTFVVALDIIGAAFQYIPCYGLSFHACLPVTP